MYSIQGKKRVNSRKFDKTVFQSENKKDILDYLKRNNLRVANIPYIFTHINLTNGQILTCSVRDIICSPQTLADYLQAQGLF